MTKWRQVTLLLVSLAAFAGSASAQDEFASDAAHLVTALKLGAGQTVADIGAGRGQLAVALAREVGLSGRVYATELNADRLRDIRQLADSLGLNNVSVIEATPRARTCRSGVAMRWYCAGCITTSAIRS